MKLLLEQVLGENYSKIDRVHVNGQNWYKAQDVCRELGLKNTSLAVKGNLRIGYFGVDREDILDIRLSKRSPLFISEAGMFKLIMKCRKPAAYMIKVYLSENVLPAIMRTGEFERRSDSYPEQGGVAGGS